MRKRLFVITLFCVSLVLFVLQTVQAFGIVEFHADFFRKKGTVVLDAGHGGEDGGAVGINNALEKDVNLAICLELEKYLLQSNFDVIMVRNGDYSVGDRSLPTVAERKRSDTKRRLQIIEEAGDCIYIGIHQNHFSQSKYSGAQIFYSGNDPESAVLAEEIRASIIGFLQPDNHRESKQADKNIYILRNSRVPSVLVECGFLSNPDEAEKLCDSAYQRNMAAAIYNGLIGYLEEKGSVVK